MKQIAGIAIVTIMLVGCSNRVAPKRTTFAAPEALIVAKAGPSDVYWCEAAMPVRPGSAEPR
jgi:PBP1b-binding outer membrane lipoprotein LpoB